ncbi:MAG: hypothetical protein JSS07_00145 [Proteobacteria bacterium]|nr:hypothetical protein [Pseudomonadota bacterium]
MLYYYMPAKSNGIDDITVNYCILFNDINKAVVFALQDLTNKNEELDKYPIFEFVVKDKSRLKPVKLNESGQVVSQGGFFDAWQTDYSNLIKIRAMLGYIQKDVPDFVFASTPKASVSQSNKSPSLFHLHKIENIAKAFQAVITSVSEIIVYYCSKFVEFGVYASQDVWFKSTEKVKHKVKIQSTKNEAKMLVQQIKELQSKLGYADDDPIMKKLEENFSDEKKGTVAQRSVLFQRAVLEHKKQTLSDLVAANDEKRKEIEANIKKEGVSYYPFKSKKNI